MVYCFGHLHFSEHEKLRSPQQAKAHNTKTHCLHSTKYYENNAFYIFKESIFYFCFGCSYMYPNGEFCPKVFKINLHEDIININPTHLSHLPFHLEYTVQSYLTLSNVFFQFYPSLILYHHYY